MECRVILFAPSDQRILQNPERINMRSLHVQILIALILGAISGQLLGESVLHFAFVGTLFLKGLKMIIVPLIVTSIVSGVVGIGQVGHFGRLSAQTFTYYTSSSLLSIITGLVLVNAISPGKGAQLRLQVPPEQLADSIAQFGDGPKAALERLLLDMVPDNVFEAMAEGQILPVIVFCFLLGFAIIRLSDSHQKRLRDFFQSAFEVMMRLTHFIIRLAPIGIFALVAKVVGTTGPSVFVDLGLYALTVLVGLIVHAAIILPLVLYFFGGISPLALFRALTPALLTAFSTSSSSATLPITIESLEQRAGVSNRTTSFVAPLGATINMDGTALFECVAALFIAQAYGVELGFTQQFVVVLTALLASIGAAGIPMTGLVMLSIVLTSVGLPLEGIGLILAVDRILDMFRTTVNVWSDSCGTVLIARRQGEKLDITKY